MRKTEAVARLLEDVGRGERSAFDELFSLLYAELHAVAAGQRRRFAGAETLNTTAVVHEMYLKLADRPGAGVASKAHFMAVAAKAMRQVVLNHARDRVAQKRGGGWRRTTLDEAAIAVADGDGLERAESLLALDAALERLAACSDRSSRIVECRVFGGMTIDETAAALGISTATVTRGWATAQAWLHRELEPDGGAGAP